MTKLFRLLRTALFLIRTGGTWADGTDWTQDDARALASFLHSETGEKLSRRLRNVALSMNANAVQWSDAWRNGHAAGYMLAATDIQTLSADGAPQDSETSEEADAGAAAELAHLAP